MSGGRAQRAVALAQRIPEIAEVAESFDRGALSLDQLRVFTDLPERLLSALGSAAPVLVDAVGSLSVADTRRAVAYWRWAVDGPGASADAEQMIEERYFHLSRTWGGMVKGDFLLDPVAGEIVSQALAAATPPRREGDDRTPRRRRADALTELARSFLDLGEAQGTEKPHLLVLTDLEALAGNAGGLHETIGGEGSLLLPWPRSPATARFPVC